MKKFTLYTETKANLGDLTAEFFESYTMIDAVGSWEGKPEYSTQIIVLSDTVLAFDILKKLADKIKEVNNQEAVLLTEEDVKATLL